MDCSPVTLFEETVVYKTKPYICNSNWSQSSGSLETNGNVANMVAYYTKPTTISSEYSNTRQSVPLFLLSGCLPKLQEKRGPWNFCIYCKRATHNTTQKSILQKFYWRRKKHWRKEHFVKRMSCLRRKAYCKRLQVILIPSEVGGQYKYWLHPPLKLLTLKIWFVFLPYV